mgnify:FL=1
MGNVSYYKVTREYESSMIMTKSIVNLTTSSSNLTITKKFEQKSLLTLRGTSATVALSLALAACNDTTTVEEPCLDYDANGDHICIDSALTEVSSETNNTAISIPTNQAPVSGTFNSDTFVANSGFLTSKTVIDGGDGIDTLNLNLKNSVKKSPSISNIENLSLSSFGDYSVNLANVSGLEYIQSENSLGNITITGLSNPQTVFGFSGDGINSTILTNNELGGTADVLKLKLIDANNVSFRAPIGYEELELDLNGDSSLNYLLATGVSTATIYGTGDLSINSNFVELNSLSTELLDGKLVGAQSDMQGFATNGIIGSNLGTAISLGPHADNIHFLDKADNNSLNTIELGADDDKLSIKLAPNSQNSIFGGQGNDEIKLTGAKASVDDFINGGIGSDTVTIEQAHDNTLSLFDIEHIN